MPGLALALFIAALLSPGRALAADRLAWTGAVTQAEGAGGAGLVPWALIAGLGTRDEIGGSAFVSYVSTADFSLRAGGVAAGFYDRVELSFARQRFDAAAVIPGLTLGQDVFGLKVKVVGDAVFAPDQWLPQLAVGLQEKKTLDFDQIPHAVGARAGHDLDIYAAATKLYFAALAGRNVIVNATVRRSRANQFGLLAFGGDRRSGYRYLPEGSIGVFVTESILAGGEWRSKPDNLGAFDEGGAKDVFIAWNPQKSITATLAWIDLGGIAGKPVQHGLYASLWCGF
jgi:hypothetical protein